MEIQNAKTSGEELPAITVRMEGMAESPEIPDTYKSMEARLYSSFAEICFKDAGILYRFRYADITKADLDGDGILTMSFIGNVVTEKTDAGGSRKKCRIRRSAMAGAASFFIGCEKGREAMEMFSRYVPAACSGKQP